MADVIEMIQLSPTMEEGLLVEWLKKEGDTIEVGELIAEIETDKASMEMESYYDGTILKLLAQEGDSIPIGQAMAIIGEPDEDISDLIASSQKKSPTEADTAPQHDETPPAQASDETPPFTPSTQTQAEDTPSPANSPARTLQPASTTDRVLASPLARRMAEEHAIALEQLRGSGPAGRIIKRDVRNAIETGETTSAPTTSAQLAAVQADTTIALSPMRKAVAQNTSAAWQHPAFMLTRSIVMDRLLTFRKELNAALQDEHAEQKISINDLIIKAAALALRDQPAVHVAFEGDHIRQYGSSRIGIAVALDGGLITAIIAQAEHKNMRQISQEVQDLANRARAKKLSPNEYTGASFSISNLGMFGIEHFTAVLNPPGAAILAIGQSRRELVPDDSPQGFTTQTIMRVTLTCDHRAIDGATGAQWLQIFARYLEQPATLLL